MPSALQRMRSWLRVDWPKKTYLVAPHHRLIYCPIEKNACSSIKRWMHQFMGYTNQPFDYHKFMAKRHSLRGKSPRKVERLLNDPTYLKIAVVRNPWSRLVSGFLNKIVRPRKPQLSRAFLEVDIDNYDGLTFRQFVQIIVQHNPRTTNSHWRPQHLFLADTQFDIVGRMEQLPDFFEQVSARLKISHQLPQVNRTQYDPEIRDLQLADTATIEINQFKTFPSYHCFYDQPLIDLVATHYRQDVEQFGYGFSA
ncbi:MAG: sulfotransferase family protein [Pirellulaceae bacterium]